ncbi:predicted protein [Nematostella vectensis]|uniref:Methyltransferase type 11 domain-containing protein n=1 Tax=Nematostella vectensis TaxID=45351 RepID=A7SZN3_NEMVE|nr:predicted protein [Nematostella vectensis]|eukprot:XP_001622945.1 predicted protein [Nematostella vectensis]
MENIQEKLATHHYKDLSIFQKKVANQIFPSLPFATAKFVLDLGCGTGDVTGAMAANFSNDASIIGIDPDKYRVELAKSNHCSNVQFLQGSAESFPHLGEEYYDLVFSNFVLHWIPQRTKAFRDIYDSLKPGGMLVMVYATRETQDPDLNPYYKWLTSVAKPEEWKKFYMTNKVHELTLEVVCKECSGAGFKIISNTPSTITATYATVDVAANYVYGATHGVVDIREVVKDTSSSLPPLDKNGEVVREVYYGILFAIK